MTDEIKVFINTLRAEVAELHQDVHLLIDLSGTIMRKLIELEGEKYVPYGRRGPDGKYWAASVVAVADFEARAAADPTIHKLSEPVSKDQAWQIAANIDQWANKNAGNA